MLELPHTHGCLVCGRDNPHGLHLTSWVDPATGSVSTTFTPQPHHIGFESIIHGGVLATVLDEIMVWAAIWASGKACVAAELSLRFVNKAAVGEPLSCTAKITRERSRLIEAAGEIRNQQQIICTAAAKYAPLGETETAAFLKTFVDDPATLHSASQLRSRLL